MSIVQSPISTEQKGDWRGCNGHTSLPLNFHGKIRNSTTFLKSSWIRTFLENFTSLKSFQKLFGWNLKSRRGLVFLLTFSKRMKSHQVFVYVENGGWYYSFVRPGGLLKLIRLKINGFWRVFCGERWNYYIIRRYYLLCCRVEIILLQPSRGFCLIPINYLSNRTGELWIRNANILSRETDFVFCFGSRIHTSKRGNTFTRTVFFLTNNLILNSFVSPLSDQTLIEF